MHEFVIAYPFAIIDHTPLRSEVNKGKLLSFIFVELVFELKFLNVFMGREYPIELNIFIIFVYFVFLLFLAS
jgi:hypothetical protein